MKIGPVYESCLDRPVRASVLFESKPGLVGILEENRCLHIDQCFVGSQSSIIVRSERATDCSRYHRNVCKSLISEMKSSLQAR